MKIALLGAPGSGKTDVAKRIAAALNRDQDNLRWRVIDDYVEKMTKRTGGKYGHEAGYIQNTQIMCERWLLEEEMQYKGYSTITCGSVYDTVTYAALLNVVPPTDEQERLLQYQVVSTMLGFYELVQQAAFDYDHMFFLPWATKHDHTSDALINAKIPEVLSAYNKTATLLTGDTKKKAKDAIKVTRFIRDKFYATEAAAVDEQQAVRGDGDAGESSG